MNSQQPWSPLPQPPSPVRERGGDLLAGSPLPRKGDDVLAQPIFAPRSGSGSGLLRGRWEPDAVPLPIPNLDDRTFEQLVAEGRALIPRYSPAWTNHNASDPGITLLELFAFLTESAMFQADQLPAATIEAFLRLIEDGDLGCPRYPRPADHPAGAGARNFGAGGHSSRLRAAGARDRGPAGDAHRADGVPDPPRPGLCADRRVGRRTGDSPGRSCRDRGPEPAGRPCPFTEPALIEAIFTELRQHRLLATRLHVVGPTYVEVGVQATVARDGAEAACLVPRLTR